MVDAGPSFVYHNFLIEGGIVVESTESTGSNEQPHRILFNTFSKAIQLLTFLGSTTQPNEFINNLGDMALPEFTEEDLFQGDLDSWEVHHNFGIYQLRARGIHGEYMVSVPYIDTDAAGAGAPIDDIPIDYFGNERPDPPTVGAVEAMGEEQLGYDPNDDQHTPDPERPAVPDPMDEGQHSEDSPATTDEGCGCSSHGSDATPLLALLMIPAILWRRRKRGGTGSNEGCLD